MSSAWACGAATAPPPQARTFAGEHFVDLGDAQRRAEVWCRDKAGMRLHGATQCRPAEAFAALEPFAALEAAHLLAPPSSPYDLPVYAEPKVHRDHHVEVAKALSSVPGNLIGHRLEARTARRDASMCLENCDDTAEVSFDRQTWSELCSLRFVDGAHNVVMMGPAGWADLPRDRPGPRRRARR